MLNSIFRGVVVTLSVFAIIEGISAINDPYKQQYYADRFKTVRNKAYSFFNK